MSPFTPRVDRPGRVLVVRRPGAVRVVEVVIGVGGLGPARGARAVRGDRPAGQALEEAHPVVVLGTAHRDRQDELGRGRAGRHDGRDPEDLHEERADRGRDGHMQATRVAAVLERRDGHPATGRVPVLGRFLVGGGVRLVVDIARQPDHAGQGRGIGGALDAQGVGPVPADVDDDGGDPGQDEDAQHEQDQHLAARGQAAGGQVGPRRASGRAEPAAGGEELVHGTAGPAGSADRTDRSLHRTGGSPVGRLGQSGPEAAPFGTSPA